ncbi:MAG: hypothetical protein ACK42L_08820, partial [Thermoanaerobaculum sp.]
MFIHFAYDNTVSNATIALRDTLAHLARCGLDLRGLALQTAYGTKFEDGIFPRYGGTRVLRC